jgi:hypothetical protein
MDAARHGGGAHQGGRRGLRREALERRARGDDGAQPRRAGRRQPGAARARAADASGTRPAQSNSTPAGMVWRDAATQRVLELACQVARADLPILITGPTAAARSAWRRIIQANSSVRDGPFVTAQLRRAAGGADRGRSSSAREPARTPAPPRRARASSRRPTAARSSSTRSATFRPAGQVKLLRVLETGASSGLGSNDEKQVPACARSAPPTPTCPR